MTDNEKLARFQGKCYHVSDWGQTNCKYCGRITKQLSSLSKRWGGDDE